LALEASNMLAIFMFHSSHSTKKTCYTVKS